MKIAINIEVIKFINDLNGYQGYVQFSHRAIDKARDIFITDNPKIENENGFVFEAHFANNKESISIKQINDSWIVSRSDISNIEDRYIQSFLTDIKGFKHKVKMAQIWETKEDNLCENMRVMNLQKVVFAGFKHE